MALLNHTIRDVTAVFERLNLPDFVPGATAISRTFRPQIVFRTIEGRAGGSGPRQHVSPPTHRRHGGDVPFSPRLSNPFASKPPSICKVGTLCASFIERHPDQCGHARTGDEGIASAEAVDDKIVIGNFRMRD